MCLHVFVGTFCFLVLIKQGINRKAIYGIYALHFEQKSPLDVSHTPSGDFCPIQEIFPDFSGCDNINS